MPKYMLLLGGVDPTRRSGTETYEEIIAKYVAWGDKLRANKQFVSTHKLKDGQGRRLVSKAGKVVDGPFAESKETIGGFYIIEATDLAEATLIARECPTVAVQQGFCEVREVEI